MQKHEVKQKVIKNIFNDHILNNLTEREQLDLLSHGLDFIRNFRNVAAHGGRIYNYTPSISIKQIKTYQQKLLKLTGKQIKNGYGTKGLGALIDLLGSFRLSFPFEMLKARLVETLSYIDNENLFNYIIKQMYIPQQRIKFKLFNRVIINDDFLILSRKFTK